MPWTDVTDVVGAIAMVGEPERANIGQMTDVREVSWVREMLLQGSAPSPSR